MKLMDLFPQTRAKCVCHCLDNTSVSKMFCTFGIQKEPIHLLKFYQTFTRIYGGKVGNVSQTDGHQDREGHEAETTQAVNNGGRHPTYCSHKKAQRVEKQNVFLFWFAVEEMLMQYNYLLEAFPGFDGDLYSIFTSVNYVCSKYHII